jgi:hypothetical protein
VGATAASLLVVLLLLVVVLLLPLSTRGPTAELTTVPP